MCSSDLKKRYTAMMERIKMGIINHPPFTIISHKVSAVSCGTGIAVAVNRSILFILFGFASAKII